MVAIINVDNQPRIKGAHRYELKINRHVVAVFNHNREEPLSALLLKASIAAKLAEDAEPINSDIATLI